MSKKNSNHQRMQKQKESAVKYTTCIRHNSTYDLIYLFTLTLENEKYFPVVIGLKTKLLNNINISTLIKYFYTS